MAYIKYVVSALALTATTCVFAANCEKNPNHPNCGVPIPDLTDRVEALEITTQELTTRVQDLEDALGYLQPQSGKTLVMLDAADQYVGTVFHDLANYILIRTFDGYSGVYELKIGTDNTVSASGRTYFTDSTCGLDNGDAYVQPDGPYTTFFWDTTGFGLDGEIYIALESGVGTDTDYSSWITSLGTCEVDQSVASLLPAVMVAFNITYPIRYDLR